jgi:hypothetical protein
MIDPEYNEQRETMLSWIGRINNLGLTPHCRAKSTALFNLAKQAHDGIIIELGCFRGQGSIALWYGAQDGHQCDVYAVDDYSEKQGWIGEPYGPQDRPEWFRNTALAGVQVELLEAEGRALATDFPFPVALLVWDMGTRNRAVQDVQAWSPHILPGGLLAIRDIDDGSLGANDVGRALALAGGWEELGMQVGYVWAWRKL